MSETKCQMYRILTFVKNMIGRINKDALRIKPQRLKDLRESLRILKEKHS